jgi:haloalkane dehalogenase
MTGECMVLRTPEERFNNLPDYAFASNYVFIGDALRMHYVDEGDKKNPLILLLHGEPSWSFLYRNIIPLLVQEGYRVIAPDLIGFGKSDKFVERSIYTYQNHTAWLKAFIQRLSLENINLFCHDWGGMIALRLVATNPNLFSSVIVSYAFLFTGKEELPRSFKEWQLFSQRDLEFSAGSIVAKGTYTELKNDIREAYNAPFPDESYKAAARQFPVLFPTNEEDPEGKTNALLREKLKAFDKPFLTVWGNNLDEMWQGKDKILQQEIPGANGQDHRLLHADHFLQEDKPNEIAEIIIAFLSKR